MSRMFINLSGQNGVGKDTVAKYVDLYFSEYSHNIKTQILSLAKPVKECLSVLSNEPVEFYSDREYKELEIESLNITRRQLMIDFSDALMQIHPDIFWINALDRIECDSDIIIITDYRFMSWASFLERKKENFINIEIIKDVTKDSHVFKGSAEDSSSYILNNSESLGILKGVVFSFLNDCIMPELS